MKINQLFGAAAFVVAGSAAFASAFVTNFDQARAQAAKDNKMLVVSVCAVDRATCARYQQDVETMAREFEFRDEVVFVWIDEKSEGATRQLGQRLSPGGEPMTEVLGPNLKTVWVASGEAPSARIAQSLRRGICAATNHNYDGVPSAFRAAHGPACREIGAGVSWSEPETIRPPR